MIAVDLGYTAIDETDCIAEGERSKRVAHLSDRVTLCQILRRSNIVVQAPSAAAFCHDLPPDVAVAYMVRPLHEILASEQRINWKGNGYELKLLGEPTGNSAAIKYERWRWQRPLIRHGFEIEYASLRAHPLWVDADQRRTFGKKQIAISSGVLNSTATTNPFPH